LVEIRVSDTGVGISPEHLPLIFTPFFTTKEAGVGTGLGLYISHMIIEREGGTISVESEVNAGTTFTVLLPSA
jgi:signal transduction histidine kinase